MARRHWSWEDYYIPGTTTLRNKFTGPGKPFGEPDSELLRQLEEMSVAARLLQLSIRPVRGLLDYAHMKAVHRFLFQDAYEWAGEERTAPTSGFMVKDGHAYYPAGPALTAAAEAQYQWLAERDHLRGLDEAAFLTALAESWGELNVVHSFREGNTRAQAVFYGQLCAQAGYFLETAKFAPGASLAAEFIAARFHSQDAGDNSMLADVLARATRPL